MTTIPTALVLGFSSKATNEEVAAQAETWRSYTEACGLSGEVTFTVKNKKITITSTNPERLLAIAKSLEDQGARCRVINEADMN